MNKTIMSILAQVSLWEHGASFRYVSKNGTAGLEVDPCSVFKGSATLVSRVDIHT